jgi:hypothetical protein
LTSRCPAWSGVRSGAAVDDSWNRARRSARFWAGLTHKPSARRFQVGLGEKSRFGLPVIGEQKHQHFVSPARIAHHRDFFDVLVVSEEKADVAPLIAGFPTAEILQMDQYLNLAGRKDILSFNPG